MSRKNDFQFEYYNVQIPGDPSLTVDELCRRAIQEAEDKATLQNVKSTWSAMRLRGSPGDPMVYFRVKRKVRRHT